MVSVDGSLFIQIFNFLFLIWALNIVLYKPIRKMLLERKGKIDELDKSIDGFISDAEKKRQAFDDGIKRARAKGLMAKDAFLTEAAQEEKQMIERINEKAQESLEVVRKKIIKEAEVVRVALQAEINVFATAIGEKILGRAI